MLSDRAREQWAAYVQARGSDTALFDERDELHRFMVGLHVRGEPLSAADLASLLDAAGLAEGDERDGIVSRIEAGLALLDSYERHLNVEHEVYGEVERYGGFEI